jgi:dTDP-glucose 4,6-dehydratase
MDLTILEFAERISGLMERELKIAHEPLPSDDPRKRQPDISKARRILGWEPKVSLEDGLRETIDYFKALEGASARR